MMARLSAFVLAIFVACAAPSAVMAKGKGVHGGDHPHSRHPHSRNQQAREAQPRHQRDPHHQRDPLGIIQGQGVSSLYGGMGNMGGGSGRSTNTGVGLGAHGNSQGPRF